ncbi:putative bifunctional diguanylate cyclase/phosphodiesterase [Shewanella subflava]|uniref:GGDEF and EAL domain-containing protein n=1 Tax=Shewanella subflava TaxID=2986476 RepID=A0ABT3ID20_9GAMM|nr:GGDEF and EAL domain-containing protein [Shewanella subflava]MCW3173855.1 GGDEF and EAL domain-containing protein [Shewanella subflava]
MTQEQNRHLLELIVNSSAKQQGNFTKTSELVSRLLQEHFVASSVSVWLFDEKFNGEHSVTENDQTAFNSCSKRLIAHYCAAGLENSKPTFDPQESEIQFSFFDELRRHRFIAAQTITAQSQLIHSFDYYQHHLIHSTLNVAIRINGHIEGVLTIEFKDEFEWLHDQVQIVIQCADQLALTLATRYSYDKSEQINLLRNAAEHSDHVVMIVNLDTLMVEYVNFAHQKMTGLLRTDIEHHSVMNLDIFRNKPDVLQYVLDKLAKNESVVGDIKLKRLDNREYWLHYHVTGFTTQLGNSYALVSSYDISSEFNHKAELERLAWHCSLTGLHNRSFFTPILDRATDGVLLLVDLLGFKRFNDSHGHEQGDSLLIEVARRLKHFGANHQAIDVARIGSDEFCILLPKVSDEIALDDLVSKLMANLSAFAVINRERVEPKPAIAVVDIASVLDYFPPLSCADIALQYAKRKSLEHYQFFNQDLLAQFKNNAAIEKDLQYAIKGRQFELYYQPLMDLQNHRYIGAEALIRWNHPKKGVLYPGAFIDIAEQSGMINALGAWVLENACKQLNLWQHKNVDITMHVNVAARQFFSGDLFEQVWDLLNRYRIKPKSLILEITETELMGDIRYASNLCQELADLGVGIAIDDFGTGYSSMKYLKQFPITKLKIDRSFIMDISSSKQSREIVSAIIAMAKALNISITAEGVETMEQEVFLEQISCEHAQGFLYSPAIRVNDFNNLILTKLQ